MTTTPNARNDWGRTGSTLLLALVWPAAAAVSLAVAVGGHSVTLAGLALVACGTMSAYGLDRWIDRRGEDSRAVRRAVAVAVAVTSLSTALLALSAAWRVQVCFGLAVLAGGYVPLKRIIPKNVLTTVAWTTAVSTLPFPSPPALDSGFGAAVLAVACIMAANTVICDLPDVSADRAAGVRGITPRFGPRVGSWVAMGFAGLGVSVAGVSARWGLAATSAGLGVLAFVMGRNPQRPVFRQLADGIVTVLPGPLAWWFH